MNDWTDEERQAAEQAVAKLRQERGIPVIQNLGGPRRIGPEMQYVLCRGTAIQGAFISEYDAHHALNGIRLALMPRDALADIARQFGMGPNNNFFEMIMALRNLGPGGR